jgi:hypothetical protein
MPMIERLKSFFELQLEGWGPEELVSIGAELGVAACLAAPFVAFGVLGRWVLRKKGLVQPGIVQRRHPGLPTSSLKAVEHRS